MYVTMRCKAALLAILTISGCDIYQHVIGTKLTPARTDEDPVRRLTRCEAAADCLISFCEGGAGIADPQYAHGCLDVCTSAAGLHEGHNRPWAVWACQEGAVANNGRACPDVVDDCAAY